MCQPQGTRADGLGGSMERLVLFGALRPRAGRPRPSMESYWHDHHVKIRHLLHGTSSAADGALDDDDDDDELYGGLPRRRRSPDAARSRGRPAAAEHVQRTR